MQRAEDWPLELAVQSMTIMGLNSSHWNKEVLAAKGGIEGRGRKSVNHASSSDISDDRFATMLQAFTDS
ncbi:hypothetical protein AAC387_Pa04g1425 [Persea americana]